jgi:hypothetical protein
MITYELAHRARVQLDVYDVLGRHMLRVADEFKTQGLQTARLDGSGIGAGMYFVRLRVDGSLVGTTAIVKH